MRGEYKTKQVTFIEGFLSIQVPWECFEALRRDKSMRICSRESAPTLSWFTSPWKPSQPQRLHGWVSWPRHKHGHCVNLSLTRAGTALWRPSQQGLTTLGFDPTFTKGQTSSGVLPHTSVPWQSMALTSVLSLAWDHNNQLIMKAKNTPTV